MSPQNFLFRVQQLIPGEDNFVEFECNFFGLCLVLVHAPIGQVIKVIPIDDYKPLNGDLLPVCVESDIIKL